MYRRSHRVTNIQFLKFYFKDWLFLEVFTKLQIDSSQLHDLMLLRKLDACFEPPHFCRSMSEYFFPERLF